MGTKVNIKIDGVKFPIGNNPMSQHEAQKLVSRARKKRKKLKKALKEAGKSDAKKKAQHAYISSARVRFAALVEAAKRLKRSQRKPIPEYWQIAISFGLHEPIHEEVLLHPKKTSGGGYRYFCEFGVRHRAAQAIVADMVRVQFKPKSFQYDTPRKGVRCAVRRIREKFDEGFVHGSSLDIKKFYDSFHQSAMLSPALPIPDKAVSHVVIGKHFSLSTGTYNLNGPKGAILSKYLNFVPQAGIPLGSAASPIIGNFFVSKFNVKKPKGSVFYNYVDDFLILAKTPETVIKAENALKSAVADIPVGEFELLEKSGSSLLSGVEFLGHQFQQLPDGTLSVTVTESNQLKLNYEGPKRYEQIEDTMNKFKSNAGLGALVEEKTVEYARYLLGWLEVFSEADDIGEHQTTCDEFLHLACDLTNLDIEEIKQSAKKLGLHRYAGYPAP